MGRRVTVEHPASGCGLFDGAGGEEGRDQSGRIPGQVKERPVQHAAHQEPAKRLKSPVNGQSGHARQTQSASFFPGAIAGLVQPQGHLLARSSQP